MRISYWRSDVCSSDLVHQRHGENTDARHLQPVAGPLARQQLAGGSAARPLEREAYRASGAGDTLQGIAAVDRGIAVRHAEGGDDDLAGLPVVDEDARLVALNLHQPLVDCTGTDGR